MANKNKMVPFGILNMDNDQMHIVFGNSYKTSDFICDGIEKWWKDVRKTYSGSRWKFFVLKICFSQQKQRLARNTEISNFYIQATVTY